MVNEVVDSFPFTSLGMNDDIVTFRYYWFYAFPHKHEHHTSVISEPHYIIPTCSNNCFLVRLDDLKDVCTRVCFCYLLSKPINLST